MSGVCTDNRFELIKKYKQKLIEGTNIETRPEEMAVIDNILFRFWQMDWLNTLEGNSKKLKEFTLENKRLAGEVKKLKEAKEIIKAFCEYQTIGFNNRDIEYKTITELMEKAGAFLEEQEQ